jgi:hypothetical protein
MHCLILISFLAYENWKQRMPLASDSDVKEVVHSWTLDALRMGTELVPETSASF